MSFTIKKEGEIVVVDVEGQLIVGNRQELKQKVLDELERGEKKFLIDFAQTGYIDSSGLGVLVSLSKKIREQGGELRLANLNDECRDGWLALLRTGLADREIDYLRLDGSAHRSPPRDMILHVFSHGFHHRGQMASRASALGRKLPDLSYIAFTRSLA